MKHDFSLRLLQGVFVAAVALLAGCAIRPKVETPTPVIVNVEAAAQAQAARVQWLNAHPDWAITGRVAIRAAGKGGSLHVEWVQHGEAFDVSLSAPVIRQPWRLSGQPGAVTLEGIKDGPLYGVDAGQLLQTVTGWDIPVQALAYWVRGQAAPALALDDVEYGADGNVAQLSQDGWVIRFTKWQPASDGAPALPVRMEAERGDTRVRLVVDDWAQVSAAQ